MPTKIVAPEIRFWAKVQKTDSCWNWTGCLNNKGYGEFFAGPGAGYEFTHRFSWILHFGSIPSDMKVLHQCDNPKCVRPDHLFLGTQIDNIRDMCSKGRESHHHGLKGEKHPKAKLTDDDVRFIRESTMTGRDLALKFGVWPGVISGIRKRQAWSHVQ